MDNERADNQYIITVKVFTGPFYSVPPAGTKAYALPNTSSTVVYTFPPPSSTAKYVINSLVFCGGDYWFKFKQLGVHFESGYVKCSDINLDYSTYIAPENQTPNSEIGSNKEVIFNMWYFPTNSIKGVNWVAPLYYQYYYENGVRENSNKCTLMASISGYYAFDTTIGDPTAYLTSMTEKYWNDDIGMTQWITTMARNTSQTNIMQIAKVNLQKNNPILVGAQNNNGVNHLVTVVGYKNSGLNLSDYIVLDSCLEKFSDLKTFFTSYPKYPNWSTIGGTGYVYGEY